MVLRTVYDCSDANQATNIKNLLEYSQGYVKSQGTNIMNSFIWIRTEINKKIKLMLATIQVLLLEKHCWIIAIR